MTPSPRPDAHRPAWAATPWRERLAILRRAAELIGDRLFEYSATRAEVGRTASRRSGSGGVGRSHPLYAQTMEDNDGYDHPMGNLGDTSSTQSILRPHGVFAVVSPFNFPMALATGPSSAAMLAGNTVASSRRRRHRFRPRTCCRPISMRAYPRAS